MLDVKLGVQLIRCISGHKLVLDAFLNISYAMLPYLVKRTCKIRDGNTL